MGLLDDAIREHLELKRLRGADPGLVTREKYEAFGPVRDGESAGAGNDDAAPGDLAVEGNPSTEDDSAQKSQSDGPQDFSNVRQETAELDMRAVLDDESNRDVAPAWPVAAKPIVGRPPAVGTHPEQGVADDSLEWEMPGEGAPESAVEPVEENGHAEVGDLRSSETSDQQDEPVEDVLEETPDFLRDTPEQERLWFEQRPPRDFDFDK